MAIFLPGPTRSARRLVLGTQVACVTHWRAGPPLKHQLASSWACSITGSWLPGCASSSSMSWRRAADAAVRMPTPGPQNARPASKKEAVDSAELDQTLRLVEPKPLQSPCPGSGPSPSFPRVQSRERSVRTRRRPHLVGSRRYWLQKTSLWWLSTSCWIPAAW